MKTVQTSDAPEAIGPYSQAIQAGGILFTSGQIPLTREGVIIDAGIAEQCEQVMKNVEAILNAAGTGFDKVVKTTCFLTDMGHFQVFNEIYARYFVSRPARSCVAVKALPKGALVEVEAVALIK